MTDTKKESLSALIDGEASEIEVHRLVREYGDDASLRSSWATFQQVRSVVRNDCAGLTPAQHIELHQRISAAIETEELYDSGPLAVPARSKRMPAVAASVAVAASLVVAVFVGVNQQTTETAAPEVAAAPAALVAPPPTGDNEFNTGSEKASFGVEVSPNPNRGNFVARFDQVLGQFEYRLWNFSGNLVLLGENNGQDSLQIDQGLDPGIYLLQVRHKNEVVTTKVIIE